MMNMNYSLSSPAINRPQFGRQAPKFGSSYSYLATGDDLKRVAVMDLGLIQRNQTFEGLMTQAKRSGLENPCLAIDANMGSGYIPVRLYEDEFELIKNQILTGATMNEPHIYVYDGKKYAIGI